MQPKGDRPVIISFRPEHLIGWGLTIILCLIPAVMWFQIHPLTTIQGYSGTMLAVGRLTGLIGLVMYALNLVYSTRLRLLELMFGGLNRVYIAHHLLGGLAFILLAFHPLFLSLRFAQTSLKEAALLLIPTGLTPLVAVFDGGNIHHQVVLSQWAIFMGILAFWVMAGLLLITFFIRIPYGIWIQTHQYLGAAFFLIGLHVLFVTSDISTHAALRNYVLIMTAIGLVAFLYQKFGRKIFVRQFLYAVDMVKQTGGDVYEIYLSPHGEKMLHKAGQFIFMRFMDGHNQHIGREWHPFSISSGPGDPQLRVSIKGLGDYTKALWALQPGTTAEIEGAYGMFSFADLRNQHQIWVAGGIGITPFISMAKALPEKDFQIDLYYSVKTASELVSWPELVSVAESKGGQFRVFPYVADQQTGYLSADYIEKTSGGLEGKEIFICGPPSMMHSLRSQLSAKSIPGTSIHSEEFAMS